MLASFECVDSFSPPVLYLRQAKANTILVGIELANFIYVGELNVLDPFREGNGRTLRAFLRELTLQQGLLLRFEKLDPD